MSIKTVKAQRLSNFNSIGRDYDVIYLKNSSELHDIANNFIILGNGTNSLFVSEQSNPFVSLKEMTAVKFLNSYTIEAEAGILLPNLITQLKKKSLGGLEFTYPVPATLGAAVYQNFGAFGKEIGFMVKKVTVFDKTEQRFYSIDTHNTAEYFFYRDSYFKQHQLVITNITMELPTLSEHEVNDQLNAISNKRQSIYPLKKTLGSIFLNTPECSAGKLLDEAGLKGKVHNGAYVSEQHANIIINKSASSEDIYDLIQLMKTSVKKKANISLKEEIFIY